MTSIGRVDPPGVVYCRGGWLEGKRYEELIFVRCYLLIVVLGME